MEIRSATPIEGCRRPATPKKTGPVWGPKDFIKRSRSMTGYGFPCPESSANDGRVFLSASPLPDNCS